VQMAPIIEENETLEFRVYADMVADLYHIGHANFITKCVNQSTARLQKQYPDKNIKIYMIVGIHNDKGVESYKRLPICTMEERIGAMRSHRLVSDILPNAPFGISETFLDEHKIDLVCGNRCNTGDPVYDSQYDAAKLRNAFEIIERTPGISTSDLIERIIVRREEFSKVDNK